MLKIAKHAAGACLCWKPVPFVRSWPKRSLTNRGIGTLPLALPWAFVQMSSMQGAQKFLPRGGGYFCLLCQQSLSFPCLYERRRKDVLGWVEIRQSILVGAHCWASLFKYPSWNPERPLFFGHFACFLPVRLFFRSFA